ncbi:unnamed protein product, partial [Symbiodinium necroappetens]
MRSNPGNQEDGTLARKSKRNLKHVQVMIRAINSNFKSCTGSDLSFFVPTERLEYRVGTMQLEPPSAKMRKRFVAGRPSCDDAEGNNPIGVCTRFQGGATWLSKQGMAERFVQKYQYDEEKLTEMAELMRSDLGCEVPAEAVPGSIQEWATMVRGKGWFGLTERCLSLAREWTITSEILFELAAEQRDEDEELQELAEEADAAADVDDPTNRQEFQEWRKKFSNNVQLCAHLYRDRGLQQRIRMIALATEFVSKEYQKNLQAQKQGQAAQLTWSAARVTGSWYWTLHSTLRMMHDARFLAELGISSSTGGGEPASWDEPWVLEEAAFLEEVWRRLLVELASARTWSQCQYSLCLPFAFACVYGSGETRESGMQHIRSLDVGLATAHRIIEEHPQSPLAKEIRSLLEDCWWWRSQLSLEMLETARQCRYDGSHREAKILAMSAFGGPANSKLTAEDVFAHLQHLALRSQKGMLRMSKWTKFLYATTCRSANNNGYQQVRCSPEDYGQSVLRKADRAGLYFSPSQQVPECLELNSLEQVKEKWGTTGTIADMRMTAASATLAMCHSDDFARLPDLWTGVFLAKGLVILDEDESSACLCLGFRRWAAQSVPLDMRKAENGKWHFVVPLPLSQEKVQRPHWIFHDSADADNATRKACAVRILHPACLPTHARADTCVLEQSSEVEPLVRAALRAGAVMLDVTTLKKVSVINKAETPTGTGPVGKNGKRSIRKGDRVRALLKKLFPTVEEESPEYLQMWQGLMGKKAVVTEECADEILAGVKALDPENQEKFAGLKTMAEKCKLDKHVRQAVAAGRGSRYAKWGGVQRNLSENEALHEVVTKVWPSREAVDLAVTRIRNEPLHPED